MTREHKLELLETLLETVISNIGYPIGCGIAPHPETLRKLAEACLKVATHEDAA